MHEPSQGTEDYGSRLHRVIEAEEQSKGEERAVCSMCNLEQEKDTLHFLRVYPLHGDQEKIKTSINMELC